MKIPDINKLPFLFLFFLFIVTIFRLVYKDWEDD
jgi:hypothetical protein